MIIGSRISHCCSSLNGSRIKIVGYYRPSHHNLTIVDVVVRMSSSSLVKVVVEVVIVVVVVVEIVSSIDMAVMEFLVDLHDL